MPAVFIPVTVVHTVQAVGSRYTDWAISATTLQIILTNSCLRHFFLFKQFIYSDLTENCFCSGSGCNLWLLQTEFWTTSVDPTGTLPAIFMSLSNLRGNWFNSKTCKISLPARDGYTKLFGFSFLQYTCGLRMPIRHAECCFPWYQSLGVFSDARLSLPSKHIFWTAFRTQN
jgi:hypothetical protein